MTEAQKALAPDKRSTFTVKEPFDSDPGADIILISCDNAEFRAREQILSFISPVFSDMFSLPHAISDEIGERPETINNLPFVHLSENAVVDTLLSSIWLSTYKPSHHWLLPSNWCPQCSGEVQHEICDVGHWSCFDFDATLEAWSFVVSLPKGL